ncbi:MAG: hypothetical protein O4806_10635 [Trichodesmium sp. St5_bin8]|nr:hypothetical protein [Trichodesmium sp. St5_bin8]
MPVGKFCVNANFILLLIATEPPALPPPKWNYSTGDDIKIRRSP